MTVLETSGALPRRGPRKKIAGVTGGNLLNPGSEEGSGTSRGHWGEKIKKRGKGEEQSARSGTGEQAARETASAGEPRRYCQKRPFDRKREQKVGG